MTPFVRKAQDLLAEILHGETPDVRQAAKDRLAQLIRANYQGQSWTVDNRQKQVGRDAE